MEMLTEIKVTEVTNKNMKDIVLEMLDSEEEQLTDVSNGVEFYIGDSD